MQIDQELSGRLLNSLNHEALAAITRIYLMDAHTNQRAKKVL